MEWEPPRGGCWLARVPIDYNTFEAMQSTGLASPALVTAVLLGWNHKFGVVIPDHSSQGSESHDSGPKQAPVWCRSGPGSQTYRVVGNPWNNMVQSYRLVGPIIATNSYVMIWNIRKTIHRSSATSGAPMERSLAAKPLGLCSVFWISQIMNI